ncbi:DUF4893 domain-containing protein [Sphingomonas segetis]|uniref:DUF4893 domain-containing protein n=1 Tax=Sphingomonas segetis TaxID=1104779 RepID=UPI0012D33FFB|nr:DUF4893 domain-containing protein [Sphingomonas segetis]
MNILSLNRRTRLQIARATALIALALLAGCATKPKLPPGVTPSVEVGPPLKSEAWKAVATDADEDRLARLGLAWQEALADAKKSDPGDVAREDKLLLPRSALPMPAPTPGSYNCRMIALGRVTAKDKPYESFRPFFCYVQVEDGQLTIVKQTGSQRPAGRLWEDDEATRMIFLGSLALRDEEAPLAYGDDPKRNMAGVFERIAPFKWRLVIPWPQSGSKLNIFELTPVDFANQPK